MSRTDSAPREPISFSLPADNAHASLLDCLLRLSLFRWQLNQAAPDCCLGEEKYAGRAGRLRFNWASSEPAAVAPAENHRFISFHRHSDIDNLKS